MLQVNNTAVIVNSNGFVVTIHTDLGTLGVDYYERNDVEHEDFEDEDSSAVKEVKHILNMHGFSEEAADDIMAAESGMGEPGEHCVFDIGDKLIKEATVVLDNWGK